MSQNRTPSFAQLQKNQINLTVHVGSLGVRNLEQQWVRKVHASFTVTQKPLAGSARVADLATVSGSSKRDKNR